MIKGLKYFALHALIVALVSSVLLTVRPDRVYAGFTYFITRDGDRLMDGTVPFRFVGTNVPFLARAWIDPSEIEDAVRAAAESGLDVIRLYPFEVKMSSDPSGTFRHVMGPGQYNEQAFRLFDKLLQLANLHNVRLIVPFVDQHNYIGGTADWAAFRGKTASAFFSDATIKQDFKSFISYVLNRTNTYTNVKYKNDKAILGWQLGNELLSTDSWTSEMAAYIKSVDPSHLLGDGGYVRVQGIRPNAVQDPNIDFIDPHIYAYHNVNMVTKLTEWRNQTKGQKPLIIGEFGDYSTAQTDSLLSNVENNGTTGALFWGSMPHHRLGGWHWPPENGWSHIRIPGFESGAWAGESLIVDLLRNYAFSMKNQSLASWPTPSAPLLFPSDSVHTISWRGSPIASAYDVERSISPEGPWTTIGNGITDDVTAPRHHTYVVPLFDDAAAEVGNHYFYRIRAKNEDGEYSPYSNVIGSVKASNASIVDNTDAGYSEQGTWGDSFLTGSYGGKSRYTSTLGSYATWKPNLRAPGYYNVYVRYPYHQNSAITAQYTIFHNGQTNSITLNQTEIAGGRWRLVDTVYFAGGEAEYVKLTAAANGKVCRADSVMFEPQLFGDTFQGNWAADWTALGGSWGVSDDGSKVLKQTGTGIAEIRAGSFNRDVAVTGAVKAYNVANGAASGVVARASADFSSLYTLRLHYGSNKVQLYKKINGTWTKLAETPHLATLGTWYVLRLEVKERSLRGYVNGELKVTATDTGLSEGYAGLRTFDQTAVFDQFMIADM